MSNVRIFPRSPSLPVLDGVSPERVFVHLDKHSDIEAAISLAVGWKPDDDALWGSTATAERAIAELREALSVIPKPHVIVGYTDAIRQALDVQTYATLAQQVGYFLLSWPNAAPPDFAVFGKQLLTDLAEEEIADGLLVQAFRNLRRTAKFMPSIAEVIAECRAVHGRWRCALRNAERVEEKRAEMRAVLRQAEERLAEKRERGDGPRQFSPKIEAMMRELKLRSISGEGAEVTKVNVDQSSHGGELE